MIAAIENLLFLLLVAVAALFQFLAKTAAKANKDQTKRTSTSQTPPSIPRAARESDEEKIRRFLEALGQPPSSKPPTPVAPRTAIPPRPLAPVQPPLSPLSQLRREKQRKRAAIPKEIPPSPTVIGVEEIVPRKITAASPFEVHEGSTLTASPARIKTAAGVMQTGLKTEKLRTDITTLLASTSGLRDAIILREILSLPRGLRGIDSF
ncbi:MAG: hypothetical protein WCE87_16200 [Candidatus Udaeobacter sp.]